MQVMSEQPNSFHCGYGREDLQLQFSLKSQKLLCWLLIKIKNKKKKKIRKGKQTTKEG